MQRIRILAEWPWNDLLRDGRSRMAKPKLVEREGRDWGDVVAQEPTGYVGLQNDEMMFHGPLESIVVDDDDNVVIKMRWVAQMPAMGQPGFGTWVYPADQAAMRVVTFPNFVVPFMIERTPEKGFRARFGLNMVYFDKERADGIDPRQVQGFPPEMLEQPAAPTPPST